MNKIKSIQEIYNEAKQFDCVLTVDAALATGLNGLIDTPRLGVFAVTPRQLAKKFSDIHFPKIYSKFEFVNTVSRETGKSFRLVHAFTENILNVWNQSGLLELTEIHLTDEVKEFLPYFEKYPMQEYAMQNFPGAFFENKSIAVVGKEFFNELDLQVLPKDIFVSEINIFTDGDYQIDKAYSFGNTKTLIDNVVRLVTRKNMNQAAIVLDPASDYNVLLQTRLKEEGCDILVKNTYNENLTVRFMLSLIENAFEYESLTAKDFKEAGKLFGFETDSREDDYNLQTAVNSSKDKKLKLLFKLISEINKYSFKKFTNELIDKFDCKELFIFDFLLEKLSFAGEIISEEKLIELKYILENFELELSGKQSGVLFVNAKNSAFINRDIIFYIGLDESWAVSTNDKQYIDKKKEDENNLRKFEVLLQQGSEQLYLIQEVKDNKEVLPAPYFSIIENRTIVSFKDKIFNPSFITEESFAKKISQSSGPEETLPDEITGIAPTPLKKFVLCPAKYFYDSVTPQVKAPYFLKGNLVHEFAEFYYNHPEFCRENLAMLMDYILNKYSGVVTKSELDIERTNFKIALDNIMKFLDGNPVRKIALENPASPLDNDIMDSFRKKLIYDNTEKDVSKNYIIRGRADLRDEKTLVDYKSGSTRYKLSDLARLTNIGYIFENEDEKFDFQAISYLAALKQENPEQEKLKFIYNFILADYKSVLDERLKSESNTTEFTYIDLDFSQYLRMENCFEYVRENCTKESKKYFEILTFEQFKTIFDEMDLESIDYYDKERTSGIFCREIHRTLAREGHSYKSFGKRKEEKYKEELKKAAEVFCKLRCSCGLIFKDDVKKFLNFVEEKLKELNTYRKSNFPAQPVFESNQICKDCDYLNMCRGNLLWN